MRSRSTRRSARAALAAGTAMAALLLSACSTPVSLEPAPDANNPICAEMTVRLPDTVADQPRRDTNAQATGAWGTPESILVHCGVPPLGPTTMRCVSLQGVDWVVDDSEDPLYRFTTYGRVPAVEVFVDSAPAAGPVSGTTALVDLSNAVKAIPASGGCVGAEDLLNDGSAG